MKKVLFLVLLVLCSFLAFADTEDDLKNSIIAQFNFEISKTGDSSSNGNDMSETGTACSLTTDAYKLGSQSLNCSMVNPDTNQLKFYQTASDIDGANGNFTVCYWYRWDNTESSYNSPFIDVDASYPGHFQGSGTEYLQFGGVNINAFSTVNKYTWYHICWGWSSGGLWVSKNGGAKTTSSAPSVPDNDFGICTKPNSPHDCRNTIFYLDTIQLFDRYLLDDEIDYLYNDGDGVDFIFLDSVSVDSVNLTNRFKNFVYSNNSLPQNSMFLMQLNATGDSLVCNFSSKNISALFDNYFSENFTLTSDNSLEFSFEETSVGSEFDTINFNFCHTSAHKDLEIFINNNVTPFKTITSSLSCPLVSTVVNKTVVNTDHVNVSLRCPSCGGSNNLIILNLGGSSNFVYERFFSETTQALTFNDSIGSFWYDEHPYVFQSVGHKVIDFSCNASNFSYGVDVTDLPPVAVLGEVVVDGVEYDLSNSTVVPSGFSTEIIGNCLGDEIIVSRLLNLSYANGTFISSSISDILNFSSVEVPVDSNLSVRFACVDADGNSSFVVKSFEVLDRVNPVATYYSPLADNSSSVVKNNSFGLQMLFSDVNLYGVNVSCSHSIEGPVFDFVYLDIGGGSFFLENTTEGMNIAGTVVCEVEVCDDHTSSDYLIGSVKTSFDKRNITYRDKTLLVDLSVYDASKITFVGKPDRLSWCIDYDTFEDKFKDSSLRYSYKVNKVDGWVLRDENTAHFVNWESKEWLDLVSSQDDSFLVERVVDEGDYYVIYVESKESSICFDSIGGLNCVDDVISFSVLDAPIVPITPNYDFSSLTTAVALFLGFLGILWVILLVGAGLTRSVGLGLVSVFLGFFFGMVLIPYIVSLGVALMVVNAVLFLGFVFEGKIL